ncbi:MAG: peptide deformylase [Puniceicoccales bacterium]|jgi:peptide deformylase|nr:peptide deformylase [Puniceicoccales bacterium]
MGAKNRATAATTRDIPEGPLEDFLQNWRTFAIKEIGGATNELILRAVCSPLEELPPKRLQELAHAMAEVMLRADGVGLAAPQVGVSLRFFTVAVAACMAHSSEAILDGQNLYGSAIAPPFALFFINPELLQISKDMQIDWEGCLSIPGRNEQVARPMRAKFAFLGTDGARHTLQANGLLARCCLHENDHLDGRLFIDLLPTEDSKLSR